MLSNLITACLEAGSTWKLGGAADHFIDGSKNGTGICQLRFELWRPHVNERYGNMSCCSLMSSTKLPPSILIMIMTII